MLTAERDREKKLWDSVLATPISFYGKVIDEQNVPVPGANVDASFADQLSGQGDTNLRLQTDAAGLFHASGHGLSIIIGVSKDGYYRLRQSGGAFTYAEASGQTDAHPDPSDPAIFLLRKMGKTASLIALRHNYTIAKNGTPVEVDLKTGKAATGGQGDIEVQAWTNDQGHRVNSNEPYDWRVRIAVPGGGLVQRIGDFDFEAPADGYAESDEIDMPATATRGWSSQASKNYFLKLANGTYARLDFRMIAGGDHFFRVNSFLNPSPGDRNLEYGSSQPAPIP
jgi:hypothetical protein